MQPSRKSFLGRLLNQPEAKARVWGTAAACCAAIFNGADILRIHDVQQMHEVSLVADAIAREKRTRGRGQGAGGEEDKGQGAGGRGRRGQGAGGRGQGEKRTRGRGQGAGGEEDKGQGAGGRGQGEKRI